MLKGFFSYEARYTQQQERPAAQRAFSAAVNDYLATINSTDDAYSHLTEEERSKVRTACDNASTWLDTQNKAQEKLPSASDPVLTAQMIHEELRKLQLVANPVVNKKKPPPPKKEEKKEEKEPAKDGDEKDGVKKDGMFQSSIVLCN